MPGGGPEAAAAVPAEALVAARSEAERSEAVFPVVARWMAVFQDLASLVVASRGSPVELAARPFPEAASRRHHRTR